MAYFHCFQQLNMKNNRPRRVGPIECIVLMICGQLAISPASLISRGAALFNRVAGRLRQSISEIGHYRANINVSC